MRYYIYIKKKTTTKQNKKTWIVKCFVSNEIVMLCNMSAYHVRKFLNAKAVLISAQTSEVHSCSVEHNKTTQFLALPFGKGTKINWSGIKLQAEFQVNSYWSVFKVYTVLVTCITRKRFTFWWLQSVSDSFRLETLFLY